MAELELYAGPNALERIRQNGLKQALFDYALGASGGPKWFVLAGLDKVVFSEFFAGRQSPLHAIGSSAGAFRFACFAQQDPLAAINRLAQRYSQTIYSAKPDAREITHKGRALLDYVLGEHGVDEILNNPVIRAHFIVARCRGTTALENKPLQLSGLLASATANMVKRKHLQHFYQRFVFSVPGANLSIDDPHSMSSHRVALSTANLKAALLASGSIPVVLEGVKNIPGAPPGMYRDGGIIDYHFDLQFGPNQGLVFYPHFYKTPVPGWFDKKLPSRRPSAKSYANTLMLVPSDEFVASLPYGKIPDRKDFEKMTPEQRIPYWQKVISESDRLGEAFMELAQDAHVADKIKPLAF
ncbi:hypothetical protein [Lacimicrobium sp. SS2-24]|uniref:hypothetical protein n=1 Tax=Lacimicrobium sp. SS2-24 TaxID=2005569 RepID=UPI000B4AEFD0|nr:hypothetical protein [Lacimicrobium sp. SS2-24]